MGTGAGFPYDEMTETDHRMVRAAYWAMCDLIDAQVGRVLERAGARPGNATNTIVIFTSDHGEMLGDHGIYLKGPYFYDRAIRVPLIVSWPGADASRGVRGPGRAGRPGADAPGRRRPAATIRACRADRSGRMLTGRADADHHRDDVYCEYYNAMPFHHGPTAQLTMVRTRRHKLVVDHANDTGELYDLADDPGEHRNLWDDPAAAESKSALLVRLAHRMAETVDPLPDAEPRGDTRADRSTQARSRPPIVRLGQSSATCKVSAVLHREERFVALLLRKPEKAESNANGDEHEADPADPGGPLGRRVPADEQSRAREEKDPEPRGEECIDHVADLFCHSAVCPGLL